MSAESLIVSLWKGREKQKALCSGLRLSEKYILTVKHVFNGWPDDQPVYVRLIDGVDGDVEAWVGHRHQTKDAAILELTTAESLSEVPRLQTNGSRDIKKEQATLHVVDPVSYRRCPLATTYSIGGFDHATEEYILAPANAKGHSGGVVEVDEHIVGLLSRRKKDDPLCRAVPIHLLWPWIVAVLGDQPGVENKRVTVIHGPASAGYHELVSRVRARVQKVLNLPEMKDLAAAWDSPDPLAGFDFDEPAGHLDNLMRALYRSTRSCIPEWQHLDEAKNNRVKRNCQRLWSELTKLSVDPGTDSAELRALADGSADHLYLACQYGGTAEAVYCAVRDLPLVFQKHEGVDITSDISVHANDDLPHGEGEDLRQEVLRKLWVLLPIDEPLPGRIDGKHFEQLLSSIRLHRDWNKKQFLLVAKGPPKWCRDSNYRHVTDELHMGLVLWEEGEIKHLVIEEKEIIARVRHYETLLEAL